MMMHGQLGIFLLTDKNMDSDLITDVNSARVFAGVEQSGPNREMELGDSILSHIEGFE